MMPVSNVVEGIPAGRRIFLLEEALVGSTAHSFDHRAEQSERLVRVAEVSTPGRTEELVPRGPKELQQLVVGVDWRMVRVDPYPSRDPRVVDGLRARLRREV